MLRRLIPLTLVCTVLFAAGVGATTVIPPTFEQLVAEAQTVFVGEVINQRAIWETDPSGRSIVTIVTLKVEDVWKGTLGSVTQLEFLGGTIGEISMKISDMPVFSEGQRDVLFVSGKAKSVSPLVGFMYGRFRVERDSVGGVDRVRTYDGRSLGSLAEIGAQRRSPLLSVTPMRLADLAAAVRSRANSGAQR